MKHFGRKFDFDQGTSVVLKECRRWLPLVSWVADCGKSGTIEKSDGALPMVMAIVCCQGSWEQEAPLVAVVAQAISGGKLFPTKAQYIWKDSTSKAAGGAVYCIVCLPGGPEEGPVLHHVPACFEVRSSPGRDLYRRLADA